MLHILKPLDEGVPVNDTLSALHNSTIITIFKWFSNSFKQNSNKPKLSKAWLKLQHRRDFCSVNEPELGCMPAAIWISWLCGPFVISIDRKGGRRMWLEREGGQSHVGIDKEKITVSCRVSTYWFSLPTFAVFETQFCSNWLVWRAQSTRITEAFFLFFQWQTAANCIYLATVGETFAPRVIDVDSVCQRKSPSLKAGDRVFLGGTLTLETDVAYFLHLSMLHP